MRIIENKSSFDTSKLISMAKRENNKKRSFLIVNPSQGKHIPVKPSVCVELFRQLSSELKKYIDDDYKNLLFIGFAETATAIGAGVASFFPDSDYMQTTRESIDNTESVAEFKEIHSHAVEQSLKCTDWDKFINGKKHIIFVEDEISTGTTIMNFVDVLRNNGKVPCDIKFSVCSVINGMSAEREKELASKGVIFRYLLKISMENHTDEPADSPEIPLVRKSEKINIRYLDAGNYINSRTGVKISDYKSAVEKLSYEIISYAGDLSGKKITVIGTEECMYPAIITALNIENNCKSVVTHSTTRSPVEPHNQKNYPLKSRALLESFYQPDRKTFIYNSFYDYDTAIIITDSCSYSENAVMKITDAFCNCCDFIIVRWFEL